MPLREYGVLTGRASTSCEQDVVSLVAEGLSNAQILARDEPATVVETGETYALRGLYALTRVGPTDDRGKHRRGRTAARGRSTRRASLHATRSGLEHLRGHDGLDLLKREHAAPPASALSLPAGSLTGAKDSPAASRLKELTIGDLGSRCREKALGFVRRVGSARRKEAESETLDAWSRAVRARRLGPAWEHCG